MSSKKTKADITGLMVKPKKGWEKRTEKLAKPEHFWLSIGLDKALYEGLTTEEMTRLKTKLELVRQAASYMAAGMVKGTVKYSYDNYSIAQWMAHVIGEGADQMNYQILLADAFAKSRGRK